MLFFFQAEDGIRDSPVTGVQTCALPISHRAWYIVSAKPGAVIYKGFNPQRTLHEIRQAIESNDFDKVEQCLVVTPVKPGDCHFLHGATCNALGAGVVVAQIAMPGEGPLELFGWGQYDPSSDIEHALEDRKSTRLNSSHW